MPTLSYRRHRGDMTEPFKMLNDKYDAESCPILTRNESITRSNTMKLYKTRVRTKLHQHNFTNRITESWNSLPEEVITAKTVITFERRLDKFWKNQEILFCFDANLKTSCSHKTRILSTDEDLRPETIYVSMYLCMYVYIIATGRSKLSFVRAKICTFGKSHMYVSASTLTH